MYWLFLLNENSSFPLKKTHTHKLLQKLHMKLFVSRQDSPLKLVWFTIQNQFYGFGLKKIMKTSGQKLVECFMKLKKTCVYYYYYFLDIQKFPELWKTRMWNPTIFDRSDNLSRVRVICLVKNITQIYNVTIYINNLSVNLCS